MTMEKIDIAIVGAGVVGLAIAQSVARKNRSVYIFEKNVLFGQETSSRNSEVIHAGIYYQKGSLKARLCVEGKALLYEFCDRHTVPYRKTGKVIVASHEKECAYIEALYAKGRANGVDDLALIDQEFLRKLEPNVRGIAALYSPSTGIFDTHVYMEKLLGCAKDNGADIVYDAEVMGLAKGHEGFVVTVRNGAGAQESFLAATVINAAGLDADTVAACAGIDCASAQYRLKYCKGEYYRIHAHKTHLINGLVYPVPDEVSLGIHLTPDLAGGVRIGPNATYIERSAKEYGVGDDARETFFSDAHKLLPMLDEEDIFPDTAGIRPKLQGPGEPVKDFVISHEAEKGMPGLINLIGIESPGLTASLAIGKYVCAMIE